ncbi:MAG: hypothetical protein K0S07_495 [Chlamydiales bacterium]|jgi:L-ascorbate metabolism protein UlaG (beta-lactamase superfamily)|nr:hypothetical protein [Chlamydiales bacterium]
MNSDRISSNRAATHNLKMVANHASGKISHLKIVKAKDGSLLLQKRGVINHLFSQAMSTIFRDASKKREALQKVITGHVTQLNAKGADEFIGENKGYNDLANAVQKYNNAVARKKGKQDSKSISSLLKEEIKVDGLDGLKPLAFNPDEPIGVETIPVKSKGPHIIKKKGKNHYFYREPKETDPTHGQEASRIFKRTQIERAKSGFGQLVEKIAHIFHKEVTSFHRFHYFRKGEDQNPGEIYNTEDAVMSQEEQATSYWIGHATCFMSFPVASESGQKARINVVTDPIDGHMNPIFYRRQTDPAKTVEESPAANICLISHNHRDHFDEKTLKKLLESDPVMLVPTGDEKKLKKMGFSHVITYNWWERKTIPFQHEGEKYSINIAATPSHHWSGRTLSDHHQSLTVGFVIEDKDGRGTYYAGDTARLSEEHIEDLRNHFDIQTIFQPGGPDEHRPLMKSTHQSSADGLWMHFNLLLKKCHKDCEGDRDRFLEEAKKLKTIYMHTKTFKLGELHFDDTDESVGRVLTALEQGAPDKWEKGYEKEVYEELVAMGQEMEFEDGTYLEPEEIASLLKLGTNVIIPKIGARTSLGAPPIPEI